MKYLLLSLVFMSCVLAQVSLPDTATVSGTVITLAGEPVAGARVSIGPDLFTMVAQGGSKTPASFSVTADDQGKFTFDRVPAEAYLLSANASGYLPQAYGAGPGGTRGPSLIVVKAGDKISGLRIQVARQGIISGRVRRADGEPASSMRVYAVRWEYTDGVRSLVEQGRDAADDKGEFRITGLPPGRYLIYAAPPLAYTSVLKIERTILPTYAPSSLDTAGAIAIDLLPGGQSVADIRMREDRQFTVRGKVVGGKPATVLLMEEAVTPRVGRDSLGQSPTYTPPYVALAQSDAAGNFELRGVMAGNHRLFAFGGGRVGLNFGIKGFVGNPPVGETTNEGDAGTADIRVSDRDVDGISITLVPAAAITRKISLENSTFADLARDQLTGRGLEVPPQILQSIPEVLLIPETGVATGGRFPNSPRGGSTQKVSPGRYFLHIPGTLLPYYVKSVRLGGVDITRKAIQITGGSPELDIVVSRDGLQVKGAVADHEGRPISGATVSLWPVTPDLSKRNHGAVTAISAQDGSFTHYMVAPGEYYVAAFEGLPDQGIGQYPPFLARFTGQTERVKVALNGTATANIKLVPKADVMKVVDTLP